MSFARCKSLDTDRQPVRVHHSMNFAVNPVSDPSIGFCFNRTCCWRDPVANDP